MENKMKLRKWLKKKRKRQSVSSKKKIKSNQKMKTKPNKQGIDVGFF